MIKWLRNYCWNELTNLIRKYCMSNVTAVHGHWNRTCQVLRPWWVCIQRCVINLTFNSYAESVHTRGMFRWLNSRSGTVNMKYFWNELANEIRKKMACQNVTAVKLCILTCVKNWTFNLYIEQETRVEQKISPLNLVYNPKETFDMWNYCLSSLNLSEPEKIVTVVTKIRKFHGRHSVDTQGKAASYGAELQWEYRRLAPYERPPKWLSAAHHIKLLTWTLLPWYLDWYITVVTTIWHTSS